MSSAPSTKGCPQEARVLRAVKTGRWDDALKAHAAGCPACGEVALVSGRLLRSALETEDRRRLPDPYLVWLRAVKTGRWDDALKAHAAGCPACGEVALVSGRLLKFEAQVRA